MTQPSNNGASARGPRSTNLERRADGFLHHAVDVGQVRLHVAEARPEGMEAEVPADVPLVVFLHGFPELWWSWRHQLAAMAKAGIWAVAPDMRGYNESDKPRSTSAYEVENLAGDVAGLIRALGRKKAIVVGHDWGAMVAWAFANEYPEMLERLAILNVPHPVAMMRGLRRPAQLRRSWYIFFFQLPLLPERLIARNDFAMIRTMFREDGFTNDEIERYIDALRVPGVVPAAIAYYRASMRRVFTGRVPKMRTIEQAVLVIWGDQDRALGSEMAEPPKRLVPHARVIHIPDATHWVQNAAPERVNELLLDFVTKGA
ncbi:MAG: alpha/beta hydrolase [Labilithrix sp.]|nr:alpha/beta hydrolase [Labilithrix sp.]MBX3219278.1 alpha/beta hydrolase [Labilithrix sp.]